MKQKDLKSFAFRKRKRVGESPQLYLEIKAFRKCTEPLCLQLISFRSKLHKRQLINIVMRLEKYLKQKLRWCRV